MEKKNTQTNSYLVFKVEEELFAIHVMRLQSILEYQSFTKIPKSPKYMLGVINLRGRVLPVLDTRTVLSLPFLEPTTNTCILVLELEYNDSLMEVGIMVDMVAEVREIDMEKVEDAPHIGSTNSIGYISGVYHDDDNIIMLFDVNKLLSIDELSDVQLATTQKALGKGKKAIEQ